MDTARRCQVDGCSKSHRAKGYCSGHYQQFHAGRAVRAISGPRLRAAGHSSSVEEFFWARVAKSDGCWLWTGKKTTDGYGQVKFAGRTVLAHRHSWESANGQIPPGGVIDHLCHVPSCVNPEHLRVATHKQNMENLKGAKRNSQTQVRGVYPTETPGRWVGQVRHGGTKIIVGRFDDIASAEAAVIAKRKELFSISK